MLAVLKAQRASRQSYFSYMGLDLIEYLFNFTRKSYFDFSGSMAGSTTIPYIGKHGRILYYDGVYLIMRKEGWLWIYRGMSMLYTNWVGDLRTLRVKDGQVVFHSRETIQRFDLVRLEVDVQPYVAKTRLVTNQKVKYRYLQATPTGMVFCFTSKTTPNEYKIGYVVDRDKDTEFMSFSIATPYLRLPRIYVRSKYLFRVSTLHLECYDLATNHALCLDVSVGKHVSFAGHQVAYIYDHTLTVIDVRYYDTVQQKDTIRYRPRILHQVSLPVELKVHCIYWEQGRPRLLGKNNQIYA